MSTRLDDFRATLPASRLSPEPEEIVLEPPPTRALQFTIGRLMKLIAAIAAVFAVTPSGLAAVIVFAVLALYYSIYRCVSPGPSLPLRSWVVKARYRDDWS